MAQKLPPQLKKIKANTEDSGNMRKYKGQYIK